MKTNNVKYDLYSYASNKKFKTNFFDNIVITKYNKLFFSVTNNLDSNFRRQGGINMGNPLLINYNIYSFILKIIYEKLNLIYNDLLNIEDCNLYYENKTKFINILKFEIKRLSKINNNMSKLNKASIAVSYINDIISLYDFDDETIFSLVFRNIHSTYKRIDLNSNSYGVHFDTLSFIEKMLNEYNITDELKMEILNVYKPKKTNEEQKESNTNVIDFMKYKAKRIY